MYYRVGAVQYVRFVFYVDAWAKIDMYVTAFVSGTFRIIFTRAAVFF